MGLWWSQLTEFYENFMNGEPARIVMLGLDAAGKTTILYKVKLNENVCTIPTIGFNVETVTVKGVTFTVWDVGGQAKIRGLWRHYYCKSEGLLYVVDSLDAERLMEAKRELHGILDSVEMRGIPFVVLANKQDMPSALRPSEIVDKLELRELGKNHQWHIQGTCATSGDGIYESMEALSNLVKQYKKGGRR